MSPENPIIEFAVSSERYVKVEEIAAFLSVKPQTILDWAKRYDDFPAVQLPGSIRVRPSEVTAWLQKLTERGRANQGRPPVEESCRRASASACRCDRRFRNRKNRLTLTPYA